MKAWQRLLGAISSFFNSLSGAAIVAMMVLTCLDVLLRLFRRPIPGTYEIVGFLGTVVIGLALAKTSLEKGHIAVEILTARLPSRVKLAFEAGVGFAGAGLFGILAWQSAVYALDIRASGEVSVTLTMPIYPFIMAVAAGSGMLCLVLLAEAFLSASRMVKS